MRKLSEILSKISKSSKRLHERDCVIFNDMQLSRCNT